ncbi:Tm-1-like ATP-binding domain-containing protein [Stieleria sp. ICT_E10.1]|uniref:Tm-1-like ATP-binding domain-containing protein n=1 Tax=Stieleria sedimenti TaxID=2976331 RepID=UPI00217F59BC|nr:Tm-1-like ATP-binding domain-containing protein [Stieleria sedimenti]MCS7471361.1 Tm-1-like ATP-binding domain-containing protein [Stieleria sedimenti]
MKTIAVLGTYDTKGDELGFVAQKIRDQGFAVLTIDVGTGKPPRITPDVTRDELLASIDADLKPIAGDRGACVALMGRAAAALLPSLAAAGRIDAVLSLGGGGGTSIATAAMRALPIGFPKLMVSTVASGDTSAYIGTKDIVMMPSVVDVAGLNRISQLVFTRAVGAICGMVQAEVESDAANPIIVASMFGNTTKCIEIAKPILENAGYEVLVFHATGIGGRAMEDLIASGMVAGVLDITTTELADELLGGIMSAGPNRLEAAGTAGLPTVIAPGCLDMANFGPRSTVPDHYRSRLIYEHNPDNTLVRTTAEESARLGRTLAEQVDRYGDNVTVMIPTKAISVISAPGQPFHDPAADAALFEAIGKTRKPVVRIECEINDNAFASAAANELLRLLANR